MRTIPQKELRNQVGEVLRQAEAGEEFTITVSGRPVARLLPVRRESWIPASELSGLWTLPPAEGLIEDLADFDYELRDPWDAAPSA